MIRRARRWFPPVGVAAAIYASSSRDWTLPVNDRTGEALGALVHVVAYAILALLLRRALSGESVGPAGASILAVLVAVAFGALDEWHQTTVPGRSGAATDLIADMIGAVAGVCLAAAPVRRRAG